MFLYTEKITNIFANPILCYLRRKEKLSPPKPNERKRNTGISLFAPLSASLTVEAALVIPLFLFFMVAAMQYKLSPPKPNERKRNTGISLFAPLSASLTVEAALVIPLFLFFMVAAMQYIAVMGTAAKFGASLSETGKNIAVAAYVTRYGGDAQKAPEIAASALSAAYAQGRVRSQAGDISSVKNMNMLLSSFLQDEEDAQKAPEIAASALSAAYAQGRVRSQAGDISSVKNMNMLLSSFLQDEEEIDLVLTYQIRSPIGFIKLPANFFIQRARVRAWTGRIPAGEGGGSGNGEMGDDYVYVTETGGVYHEDSECTHLRLSVRAVDIGALDTLRNSSGAIEMGDDYVYVTETGGVYHEDSECTHLRLSVRAVDIGALDTLRNSSGAIYHNCERCARSPGSSTVYITEEGNRYHNSISCSGLKRTVRQVSRKELNGMRVCSRCGKH